MSTCRCIRARLFVMCMGHDPNFGTSFKVSLSKGAHTFHYYVVIDVRPDVSYVETYTTYISQM